MKKMPSILFDRNLGVFGLFSLRELSREVKVKKYLLLLIMFLSARSVFGEKIIFPYENNIYISDSENVNFKRLYKGNNLILKDFYVVEGEYYFIESFKGGISLSKFENNKLIPIISDSDGLTYILTDKYLFFIPNRLNSAYQSEIKIYKHNRCKNFSISQVANVNIIFNDYFYNDSDLYLFGNNYKNNNIIYNISLYTFQITEVIVEKQERDFLKYLSFDDSLIIYNSSAPKGTKIKKTRIIKSNKVEEIDLLAEQILDNEYYYFGKGFYKDYLYIPIIDEEYNTFLIKYSKDLKYLETIQTFTGIYKIIKTVEDAVCFIGYNFYKSQNQFYLCRFDLETQEMINAPLY